MSKWNIKPEVGRTYAIAHSRKGKFVGRCLSVSGDFADFEIVKGRATAMLRENVAENGDTVSCRDSMCHLTLKDTP